MHPIHLIHSIHPFRKILPIHPIHPMLPIHPILPINLIHKIQPIHLIYIRTSNMMILGVKYKIVQNLTCLNSKFWVGWFFNFNRRPYTCNILGKPSVQRKSNMIRLRRWSFFSNDAMVMFFSRAPLPTMVSQCFFLLKFMYVGQRWFWL